MVDVYSDLTLREKELLKAIVELYCKTKKPVSSFDLAKHLNYSLSPATLRNDSLLLTEKGYLKKIHSFSGRVPTDKGLRFYLFSCLKENRRWKSLERKIIDETEEFLSRFQRIKSFQEIITEIISRKLKSYSFFYSYEKGEIFSKGLNFLMSEISDLEEEHLDKLGIFLDNLDEILEKMILKEEINFFIGKENPYLELEPFAMIVALNKKRKDIFGVLSHKRNLYFKNIVILKAIKNFID
jgi:transcriptional regulator of heat shock response